MLWQNQLAQMFVRSSLQTLNSRLSIHYVLNWLYGVGRNTGKQLLQIMCSNNDEKKENRNFFHGSMDFSLVFVRLKWHPVVKFVWLDTNIVPHFSRLFECGECSRGSLSEFLFIILQRVLSLVKTIRRSFSLDLIIIIHAWYEVSEYFIPWLVTVVFQGYLSRLHFAKRVVFTCWSSLHAARDNILL